MTLSGMTHGQGRYHQRERVYGRFFRQLRLPMPVDADKADATDATFEHGVLRISLPKAEQARRRRIEVKSQGGRQQLAGALLGTGNQGMQEQTAGERAGQAANR
jgi:hypothetical protein